MSMEENNLNVTGIQTDPNIISQNNEPLSQPEVITPNVNNQPFQELITDNLVDNENQVYDNPQQGIYPTIEPNSNYINSSETAISNAQDNQINNIPTQQPVNEQFSSEVISPETSMESNVSSSNDIKISGTTTEEEINNVVSGEKVEVLDEYEIKKSVNDEKLKNKKNNIYIATIFIIIIIFIILMPYILKVIGY